MIRLFEIYRRRWVTVDCLYRPCRQNFRFDETLCSLSPYIAISLVTTSVLHASVPTYRQCTFYTESVNSSSPFFNLCFIASAVHLQTVRNESQQSENFQPITSRWWPGRADAAGSLTGIPWWYYWYWRRVGHPTSSISVRELHRFRASRSTIDGQQEALGSMGSF